MNPRFWIAAHHNNNRRAAADDRNTPLPILRFIAEAPDSDAHEVAAVASREDLVADLYYWLFDNQERWNFAEAMWKSHAILEALAGNSAIPADLRLKLARQTRYPDAFHAAVSEMSYDAQQSFLAEVAAPVLGVTPQYMQREPISQRAKQIHKRFHKLVDRIEIELNELLSSESNRKEAEWLSRSGSGEKKWRKVICGEDTPSKVIAVDGEIVDDDPSSGDLTPPEDYVNLENESEYTIEGDEHELDTADAIEATIHSLKLKDTPQTRRLVETVLATMTYYDRIFLVWPADRSWIEVWGPAE